MDRRSFLQMAAMLAVAHGLPGTAFAAAKQSAPPAISPHPFPDMDYELQGAVLKVIGVGGAGCNAVEHMIREGVTGVEYICADTDAQALKKSSASTKLQIAPSLGTEGEQSASLKTELAERDRILDALRGADLVFIIAGMGGGTGTSAANRVAEAASYLGILTVAIVTRPFESEGQRMRIAEDGIEELGQHVDSLIVISNEKLKGIIGEQVSMPEAFRNADTVLKVAVGSIAYIITVPGLIGVDFADVRTVMSETGMGMMGFATATGVDRARMAAEQALKSPLLEDANLSEAKGVLVNITASDSIQLDEIYEVMNTVRKFACQDATLIFGTNSDAGMADRLRVTLFATGLGNA